MNMSLHGNIVTKDICLQFLNILGINIGEPFEFRLIEVHQEEAVDWSQLRRLVREFRIEVRHVVPAFLKTY